MPKTKKENQTPKQLPKQPETEETPEIPKFQLAGIDISEFHAKLLNTNIFVKKEITSIPAKKPNSQQFFRIHPNQEITVNCIKWKEENDRLYLIHPPMVPLLIEQLQQYTLHVGLYLASRTPFLFPIQLPNLDGKWNSWHESQAEAVDKAKNQWIRMEPNREQGGYILHKAEGEMDEPEWPEKSIEEYLTIAFKNHVITDEKHPVVKQLRGL